MREVPVYKLAELREKFPDAYAAVHERWKTGIDEIPWSDETMDSLKAVAKAAGATLKDWSIGAYCPSYIRVRVNDEDESGKPKDAAWFRREVLKPNGYMRKNGHPYFPGLCKFTGYCADDDFIELVYKRMKAGDTLTEALESMADRARELMEGDLDQFQKEDSMEANWGDLEFTEDGTEV